VHSTLHAMTTRHKTDNGATNCRFRPKSAENGGPYHIKSQHCGRHTYNAKAGRDMYTGTTNGLWPRRPPWSGFSRIEDFRRAGVLIQPRSRRWGLVRTKEALARLSTRLYRVARERAGS
jgi:hypothetical protein